MSLARPVLEDWPIAMRLARLTQRKQFLAAAEHGRRFRSSAFIVQVLDAGLREPAADERGAGLRIGLTASRKVGNAVKRNRIRRRLRTAAGLALAGQAHKACDVVIVARPETITIPYAILVADLSVAIDRAKPGKPGFAKGRRKPPAKLPAPRADAIPRHSQT